MPGDRIGTEEPAGSDIRAALVLLFVAFLASLIVLYANEIVMTVIGAAMMVAATSDPDIWARFSIPAAITLLAIVGAILFRQGFARGGRGKAERISAFPVAVVAVAGMLAIAWGTGVASRGEASPPDISRFLIGSLLILFATFSEELLLRGLLQPILIRAWGAITGISVTALAFMAVHVAGGWRDPVSLLNIFLGGIWFGLLAFRTGGLLAPTLAHFGWNWAEEMLFGASPNPGIGAFGSVINVELAGPTIWGGSVEGLNASLALSIVLTIIIVPLAILPARVRAMQGAPAAS